MIRSIVVLAFCVLVCGCASSSKRVQATVCELLPSEVDRVLDDWHDAAARADFGRYFGHFAPGGVFMGTDATERWTVDEFKAYAKPHFDKGKAWAFTAHDRHVTYAGAGDTAWFDEELSTPHLGPCRGSGVLVREGGGWKIAQYNLSIPIPNDLAKEFVERIAAYGAGSAPSPGRTPGPEAMEPGVLGVMTFNIRYDNAGDGENAWPRRREMVARFLGEQRPDVVGLQEALDSQLRAILADRPEFGSVGVGRDDGATKGEYAAILYNTARLEVLDSGTFWFSETPEQPGSRSWGNAITRICTWARFCERGRRGHAGGTGVFYVFNVHLDHQSQPSRERSVRLLIDRIRSRGHDDPVIITGDFNAGEANTAVRYVKGEDRTELERGWPVFVDSFRAAHPDEAVVGTFHGFKGETTGEKIDYIFVSPGARVLAAAIVRRSEGERYLSDHFPVVARINPWESNPGISGGLK
ncbi:MAG: nuclear transport factor 2 family protein [Phycisphaerales bacterium]